MALLRVVAVFWRYINIASHRTLHGGYTGQYHITVPKAQDEAIHALIGELPTYDHTDQGGFSKDIPIGRFDGRPPLPPQNLKIRYMGEHSQRADWNFPAQATNPYPLWAPGRGVSDAFDPQHREYLMVIKDVEGNFHARWQRGTDNLPHPIREFIEAHEIGIWEQDPQ